jgi:hypothetical protein
MTTAEITVQESPGFGSRVTRTVGDAYDSLKDKTPTTEQVKSGISDQTARASDAYVQVKGKMGIRDYQNMTQLFREWLPTMSSGGIAKKLRIESKAAISWLTDLPEEKLEAFVRNLDTYCSSFNFALEWLIDPETNKIVDEQLKQTMGEIVLFSCLATWKADQIQDGIKVFVNVQNWLERPFAGQYEEFNHQLFAKLIAEELVPAPPLELFLAPKKDREAYSVQAIQDLIAENNQSFYTVLRSQIDVTAAKSAAETDEAGDPAETDEAGEPS